MVSPILHVIAQRPMQTGSGITLDALAREAHTRGFVQHVVAAIPADETTPRVADLPDAHVHPLRFGRDPLPFRIPGMSDVMPYPSTVFSSMSEAEIGRYQACWREHLSRVIALTQPALIHSHHVWLVSALLKDVAPHTPIVTHCHATGLRQLMLCPQWASTVVRGCARNEHFVTLDQTGRLELMRQLGVDAERTTVVGAGYREQLFHGAGREEIARPILLYAGKLSPAKGLTELLDAFELLRLRRPDAELHVAGRGEGADARRLAARAASMVNVRLHGALTQPALAELMRRAAVFVLPSYYEGVPLVLVEARASGCRIVATALPSVVDALGPALGDALHPVQRPLMVTVDRPDPTALRAFVVDLANALDGALAASPLPLPAPGLEPFRWSAVFDRVAAAWRKLGVE